MDVAPEAVAAAFRVSGAEVMIHGHTHRPAVHRLEVDGRARTRIVLGDWYEQGSALALHADGRHALQTLVRDGRPVQATWRETSSTEASSSRV